MPNFTTSFRTTKDKIIDNFVKDVYAGFFSQGYTFKSSIEKNSNLSLEKIIQINQYIFMFGLGSNCKQIYLNADFYNRNVLVWHKDDDEIGLNMIVSESDVLVDEDAYRLLFLKDKINPLIVLSCNVWNGGLFTMVQSGTEGYSDGRSIKQVQEGYLPCFKPFCIVKTPVAERYKEQFGPEVTVEKLDHDGVLIIDHALIKT